MKPRYSRRSGFTLVEIMIVVALIGILLAIAIPNFVRSRQTTQANVCINNLHQVDNAIQEWALEFKMNSAQTVTFTDISSYLKNVIICPTGGTAFSDSYTITDVGTKPVCQKLPASHILTPDTGS